MVLSEVVKVLPPTRAAGDGRTSPVGPVTAVPVPAGPLLAPVVVVRRVGGEGSRGHTFGVGSGRPLPDPHPRTSLEPFPTVPDGRRLPSRGE